MFLAYLDDPHQTQLGLKPLGERHLGMPPEERDAVVEWLMSNQPPEALALASRIAGKPVTRLSRSKQSAAYAGAFVAFAPGDVAGAYANGDADRTEALFRKLWVSTQGRKMLPAYDRERQLCPILLGMERRGVRVDLPRLRADVVEYRGVMDRTEAWVRKRLGVGPDVKLVGQQLVGAMGAAGKVDVVKLGVTPKDGKPRTDGAALKAAMSDKVLCAVLLYRSQLHTCLSTFMENWLATAEASGGRIFTQWHQVRGTEKNGTRTGRLSSTPNLQNIPTEFDPIFHHEQAGLPKVPAALGVLPSLPQVRGYIVPYQKGHVLVGRDYQGQEMRAFAHFEEADMFEAFKANPWMDPHARAATLLSTLMGRPVDRKKVAKPTGFTILYGGGAPILSTRLNVTLSEARALKEGYLKVVPGLKELDRQLKRLAQTNQPFVTWGGREYYVEPPKVISGKLQEFSYKCLNMLIQGSSADCTKHALVAFMAADPPKDWLLMLQVHDEIVLSVPKKDMVRAQAALRDAMLSAEFDVPMLSEGEWSDANWQDMKPYDVAGKVVYSGE